MDNNCHIPDLVQAFSNVENFPDWISKKQRKEYTATSFLVGIS